MSWFSHSEVRLLALASIGKIDKHWKQEKKKLWKLNKESLSERIIKELLIWFLNINSIKQKANNLLAYTFAVILKI